LNQQNGRAEKNGKHTEEQKYEISWKQRELPAVI
jgi:hypothetical protein